LGTFGAFATLGTFASLTAGTGGALGWFWCFDDGRVVGAIRLDFGLGSRPPF
jgi:hypothetical protein